MQLLRVFSRGARIARATGICLRRRAIEDLPKREQVYAKRHHDHYCITLVNAHNFSFTALCEVRGVARSSGSYVQVGASSADFRRPLAELTVWFRV
jgi:hypothetical protein